MPLLQNGLLKFSKRVILGFGIALALFGIVALGFELWRTFTVTPGVIRWPFIFLALGLFLAGLGLIQTQNPMQFIRMFREYLESRAQFQRFRETTMPGGRRCSDPPPETAPAQMPREQWPEASPEWRSNQRPRRGD